MSAPAGIGEAMGAGSAGARRIVGRVRAAWLRAVLLRALVAALAIATGVAAALVALDLAAGLPAGARLLLRFLPLAAGALPPLLALRKLVPGPDDRRLALLVEERFPALENTLSTALEPVGDGPVARAFRARSEARLAGVDPAAAAPLRLARPAAALGAGVLAGALALALAPGGPAGVWLRWSRPEASAAAARSAPGGAAAGARVSVADPHFGEIRITVRPPAYTGLPPREWEGEAVVSALPRSRVRVRARRPGGADALRVRVVGGPELSPRDDGSGGWSAEWTLSPGQRGLSLEAIAGGAVVAHRVFPLALLQDGPPVVELHEPAKDLVVATASGRVRLRASARDDYGVGAFHLSWIRSRGSGESFSFEEGTLAWERTRNEEGRLVGEYTLELAAAGLEPGDVLHLRAVARDRNAVGGPGEGVSATRLIRIAREEEMEQATTLIGFPLEAEKAPILSQRMIILRTERLRDEAPRLGREETLHEAQEIAREQARLRERVGDQIFTRATGAMQTPGEGIGFEERAGAGGAHGHDHGGRKEPERPARPEEILEAASRATGTGTLEEIAHRHDADPILAVSQPLLIAYNAMWAAERELHQGEPAASLPFQYEALRILQQQREAERVYLRGRQRVAPVDVAGARGTGKLDEAAPAKRAPGAPAPSTAARLEELEEIALRIRRLEPRQAALELAGLAVRLLGDAAADPAAAALLTRAADAAGRGARDDAASLVLRARALLAPRTASGTAVSLPAATDPVSADYFRRLGGGRP